MYTMQQFINRAVTGSSVKVRNLASASPYTITMHINNQPFDVGLTSIDCGNYFTAQQVLESYELRARILSGEIGVLSGFVSLSLTPVKSNT